MACKVALLFLVITLSFGVYAANSPDYEYCVVGAGPGGMKFIRSISDDDQNELRLSVFSFLPRLTNGILSGEGQSKLYRT
jgi:hypothetical protein